MGSTTDVLKTPEGIFVPRELIADFEGAEVDLSTPGTVLIRSKGQGRVANGVLERIDRRRAAILQRLGVLDDGAALIREARERELP